MNCAAALRSHQARTEESDYYLVCYPYTPTINFMTNRRIL